MRETYTHGHHDAVLRSHRWRTVENSAAYLLAHLRPEMALLDVGCGPGTITAGLAARLERGSVIGLDTSAGVLAEARGAAAGCANVAFVTGDTYQLAFSDSSFDVVHAHQVLQHLRDPVAAIAEMLRVTRPGGIVALRDADYGAFFWAPDDPRLERWRRLYHEVAARNGGKADAGRRLPGWARAAGCTGLAVSGSLWTFFDDESRAWWGGSWAERVERSAFADQAIAYGLADAATLAELAQAFRDFATTPGACFGVPHVEVLARA